jgi:hypothetical protein
VAALVSFTVLATAGCGLVGGVVDGMYSAVGLSDRGTVIARRAQIRSSYAVVAADLLEVKRGDVLTITDQVEFEKVLWYRVTAADDDQTEGWIEAQNVITDEILEKSRALAEEDADAPPRAAGQLRAKSNLRLSPEINDSNILYKLDGDSTFEILSWTYVPKVQEAAEVDDSSGPRRPRRGAEADPAREAEEANKLDNKYDIWYRVRLDKSVSPAPAGWLFGRQVELQIPGDIVYYQSPQRRFISWYRLDADSGEEGGKVSNAGSYLIFTRSPVSKAIDGVEPEFDGILLLIFDKFSQNHYTAYRTAGEVWGRLPVKIEGAGDNRSFFIKLRNNSSGQTEEKIFVMFKDRSRIRLTPPGDMSSFESKTSK